MITPKKSPYANTKVDPERSMSEINRMLQMYGITAYQWTTLWDQERVELRFSIELQGGRKIGIKVVPPAFARSHKSWNAKLGRNEVIVAANWAASFRCLHFWLKAKLEAVAFGLREVEEEFLSDIVVRLPTGEETTVGEALKPSLASGIIDAKGLLGDGA